MTFSFGTQPVFRGQAVSFREWRSVGPGCLEFSCLKPLPQAAKLARLNPGGADSDKLVPMAANDGGTGCSRYQFKQTKEDNKCIYKNLRLVGNEDSYLTYPTFWKKSHLVEKKWLNDHRDSSIQVLRTMPWRRLLHSRALVAVDGSTYQHLPMQ